jgi:transcriptional regulator with XRE-family HTH domain
MASVARTLAAPPSAAVAAEIQRRSGLSQAELSRRAGLPRSVLNVYLHGRREPGADTLARLAAAGGYELRLAARRPPVDPERAGRILVQVLDLAEALPYRPRRQLRYPDLRRRLAAAAA